MRYQMFGYSLVLAATTIGCGGDDPKVMVPDAKVYQDAPEDTVLPCGVTATFQSLGIGNKMMSMPSTGDYFVTPMTGTNMGKVIFGLGAGLPGSAAGAVDAMFVQVVKPANGFATAVAYPFATDPNEAAWTANAFILEDFNQQADSYTRFYYAGSGGITFETIGEANGALIDAAVSATNLREIDESGATAVDVPDGCTVSIGALNLYLKQMEGARVTPPTFTEDGLVPLTPEQLHSISKIANRFLEKQAR